MGHLTDHEAKLIKEAVARRRTPKTLVEGKWSVSPLNQDPAVIARYGGGKLPERVVLRDITLRTIDQTPGVWVTEPQRKLLAEELIRAGVSSLQIAWLAVQGAGDLKKEVEAVKKLNPEIELSVCGGTSQRVDVAADAGIDLYLAYGPIVPEFQMIHGPYAREILRAHQRGEDWRKTIAYPKTEAEFLKRLQDDCAYAKRRGMRAGMFTSMLHYATAQDVVRKGLDFAAKELEVAKADLEFSAGKYRVKGTDVSIPFVEIARRYGAALDTQGGIPTPIAFPGGAHVCEVEIDPDTGVVDIASYTAVDDCGRVMNHTLVEGQLHGGIVQGIGQALAEHVVYDAGGQLLTGSFMDYAMPRADILGEVKLCDHSVASPTNPLGVKGTGEAGTTGAIPAVANAVMNALRPLGIRHLDFPFSPSRVWQAIAAARNQG